MIECPHCGSTHTFPTPETYDERFCGECDEVWHMFKTEEE